MLPNINRSSDCRDRFQNNTENEKFPKRWLRKLNNFFNQLEYMLLLEQVWSKPHDYCHLSRWMDGWM